MDTLLSTAQSSDYLCIVLKERLQSSEAVPYHPGQIFKTLQSQLKLGWFHPSDLPGAVSRLARRYKKSAPHEVCKDKLLMVSLHARTLYCPGNSEYLLQRYFLCFIMTCSLLELILGLCTLIISWEFNFKPNIWIKGVQNILNCLEI